MSEVTQEKAKIEAAVKAEVTAAEEKLHYIEIKISVLGLAYIAIVAAALASLVGLLIGTVLP